MAKTKTGTQRPRGVSELSVPINIRITVEADERLERNRLSNDPPSMRSQYVRYLIDRGMDSVEAERAEEGK